MRLVEHVSGTLDVILFKAILWLLSARVSNCTVTLKYLAVERNKLNWGPVGYLQYIHCSKELRGSPCLPDLNSTQINYNIICEYTLVQHSLVILKTKNTASRIRIMKGHQENHRHP